MNRRDFMKAVGASGMIASAPLMSSKSFASTDLIPVGQYFVFAHLGGGWEPSTFCNPQGNRLRSVVGAELGDSNVRNPGSPVNRYPASSIRSAADIYAGTALISADMKYAPYLGTFNRKNDTDDGAANRGFTTLHIQRILSGSYDGINTLTAAGSDFVWRESLSNIQDNARRILEQTITVIELGGIEAEIDFNGNNDINLTEGTRIPANLFVYDAFVCLYADQLRVLNGVDNRTNGHDTGTRYADTGSMSEGYPDFSALYAAVNGADRPLAWVTDGGGNDSSANLVARSGASDAGVFNILGDPRGGRVDAFESILDVAQSRRKMLQASKETLPVRRFFQDQLYLVREQGVEFTDVAREINNPTDPLQIEVRDAATSSRKRHLRVGVAGFATGMASSMQVGFGGFDTHGNHDASHYPRIRDVLIDLHFLFRALQAYGIEEQTTLVVGSDFGRTPWYNMGDGKDHWAVTSYLLMGNGVSGGTAINATNGLMEAKNVNPANLAPVESGGVRMTASHVHRELRKLAGIEYHEITSEFPIDAEDLPIFG